MRERADPQGENRPPNAAAGVTAARGGPVRHGAGRRTVACLSDPSVYAAGFAFLRDGTDPPDGLHLVAAWVRPR